MRFIKERIGRTTAPVLVCTAILAVLGITVAVAAPKVITGKKVVTTIIKKVQGNEHQVTSQKDLLTPSTDLNQPTALVADQKLPKGSYMVKTTATVQRTAGVTVLCELRVGKRIDRTDVAGAVGSTTDISLGISAGTQAGGGAQLRCADGTALAGDGIVKNIEIQSLRVPKLTLTTAP